MTVEKTDSILQVSIAGQAVLVGSVLYSGKRHATHKLSFSISGIQKFSDSYDI